MILNRLGVVAQLVEQLTLNQLAQRLNPCKPTNCLNFLERSPGFSRTIGTADRPILK